MVSKTGQEFKDNKAQLTEPPPSTASYVSAFNVARDLAAYEVQRGLVVEEKSDLVREAADKNKQSVHAELETARQVNAGQSNVSISKTFGASAKRGQDQKTKNAQKASADAMFLALLDRIRDLDAYLADKYGEDFAENMVEDLHQAGKITDEERARINEIEDPEERRQAIAELIQDKLDSGEITMDDLKNYEWAEEWLKLHGEATQERISLGQKVAAGDLDADKVHVHIKKQAEIILIKEGKDPSVLQTKVTTTDNKVESIVGFNENDL
jgi:hypothetical protein